MYHLRPVRAVPTTRPMVVDHVGDPYLPIAVDNDLVVYIDTIRSPYSDSLLRLPSYRSRTAQVSKPELESPSAVGHEARLIISSVEDAGPVRVYAEVIVSDMDWGSCRRRPPGTVRGCGVGYTA